MAYRKTYQIYAPPSSPQLGEVYDELLKIRSVATEEGIIHCKDGTTEYFINDIRLLSCFRPDIKCICIYKGVTCLFQAKDYQDYRNRGFLPNNMIMGQ